MGENGGGWATARWLADRQSAENAVALGLALLVGGATGLGIVLFRKLIVWMQTDVFELLGRHLATTVGNWAVLFVPAIGGLVVGLVVRYGLAHDRYPGVAGVMEATALAGGRLEYWLAPAKTAAAVVSIGAGASV
ncbi:MAG: hypothetical protein IMX01_09760, partial [Limnochordaceae bacterium]|nr:hypothetical protein [Limnochordaceae bacterium]